MLPEFFFKFWYTETAFQRFGGTYKLYFIVESGILKNTQWNILHIFTSEDIDHVTFSNLLLSVKFHNLFAWDYIINRTLHGGLKIWLWSSSVKNNILLLVKYCFHHSKIKVISSHRRVISSIYYNVHDLKSIFNHVRNPLKTNMS
jgi:hypothetical protein